MRIKDEGRSYKGAPPLFEVNVAMDVLSATYHQEGVAVDRSKGEDKYADVFWLENLELNRLLGGKTMTETMWKCDQVRAGRLYNRMMFDTKEEAVKFAQRMQQMEPDQMFSIEAIEARQVWN